MKRLIIVGSPRSAGRSAHLAETIFETNIDEHPEDELFLVPVSEVDIGPCIACDGCRDKSGVILKGEDGAEVTVQRNRCVFDDDMQTLYDLFDDVDEVTVVSPVYFSGAPAQLKCLYDRLQPYYWAGARKGSKRACVLHVVGEGGDPHGFEALVSETRSALAVAGFRLERVLDWVGKIDEQGEITAEAAQTTFDGEGVKQRAKLDLSQGQSGSLSQAASPKEARQRGESQGDRRPSGSRSGKRKAESRKGDRQNGKRTERAKKPGKGQSTGKKGSKRG